MLWVPDRWHAGCGSCGLGRVRRLGSLHGQSPSPVARRRLAVPISRRRLAVRQRAVRQREGGIRRGGLGISSTARGPVLRTTHRSLRARSKPGQDQRIRARNRVVGSPRAPRIPIAGTGDPGHHVWRLLGSRRALPPYPNTKATGGTIDLEKILEGKTGVIFGVANKRSIAWACAQAVARQGMRLAFTYMGERMEKSVRELAAEMPNSLCLPCDVTQPETIDEVFKVVGKEFGGLDFLLHGVAFAKREELVGDFFNTSREGYMLAHEVSAYSLTAITRRALPLMEGRGGAIVTLTYIGGERVVQNYNVMGIAKAALEASVRYLAHDLGPRGIRVNAISAGPIRTLSASGVSGFTDILDHIAEHAPLRRNITAEEVGDTCLFLASPLSRGITGSIVYVDAGYHVMGV
ncbi:MAG: enoyl-ACP reductase [Planctomycetes bacterium]|nr:enoyl-ACP reductase [Planctomycetota bacterium]